MNWGKAPATESRVAPGQGPEQGPGPPVSSTAAPVRDPGITGTKPARPAQPITIDKRPCAAEGGNTRVELFTMSLGEETIEFVPFKNWGQLDLYKWTARGKLPGTPAGLEVTPEHIKITGETVSASDPDACAKLSRIFNEWRELESRNLELARKKAQARSPAAQVLSRAESPRRPLRFQVEVDKRGQVHIHCLQGTEPVTSIGLSVPGLSGLVSQGLMRKPKVLEVGALHDWVELDGELCSFEHGNNDAAKLETLLNEHYLPLTAASQAKAILVFANAASPTGFDVQFPVTVGGVQENRRRTLNDAALELLQEPVRCGLLQPGLILKISPPTLIIKHKTADGGEAYLDRDAKHIVMLTADDGRQRPIDLSQPVNYSRLSVVELAAVLNHPLINRHSSNPSAAPTQIAPVPEPGPAPMTIAETTPEAHVPRPVPPRPTPDHPPVQPEVAATPAAAHPVVPIQAPEPSAAPQAAPASVRATQPNAWLKKLLAQVTIRDDWLTCLLYHQVAAHFGNSAEVEFGLGHCWRVVLGGIDDAQDPRFRSVFLTQKGGLGFLGCSQMARFRRGVAFMGTLQNVLEGIDIHLVGLGLTGQGEIVFILRDEFRSKFGVPLPIIEEQLKLLEAAGALLLTVNEVLEAARPLELVWTVPAEQPDPAEPRALTHTRPLTGI